MKNYDSLMALKLINFIKTDFYYTNITQNTHETYSIDIWLEFNLKKVIQISYNRFFLEFGIIKF